MPPRTRPAYRTKFVRITPTQAQKWLDLTADAVAAGTFRQRTLRQGLVAILARAIIEGRWEPDNAETIKIGPGGEIVDGQHRLQAVVKARKPIQCLVAFGVPLETFATIDTGRTRTPADIGRQAGIPHATVTMSAAALWVSYETRKNQVISTVVTEPVPKDLALEVAESDEVLREVVHDAISAFRSRMFPVISTLAFAWRVAANVHRDDADLFFRSVASGEGLHKGDPALALRERLIEMKTGQNRARGTAKRHEVIWLCLRAFRAFRKGERLNRMQLPGGRLEFPKLRGA